MAGKKFNPFDLSSKQAAGKGGAEDKPRLQIHIRPELNHPLNLFLGRCEMFLERAKTIGEVATALELQKIFSTAKYLHSLINTSEEMRRASLPLELGRASATDGLVGPDDPESNLALGECGNLLIVDNDDTLLRTLKYMLEQQGHSVTTCTAAEEALGGLHTKDFDLILTDLVLPGISGYQLLELLRADLKWRDIPVIVLSSHQEQKSAVRCIQAGAEDYLNKPVDPVLLQARINACLEKRRLRELEKGYLDQLQKEQEKSERLLLNILPAAIAERLKRGESTIADNFPDVTVLFADIAGFTELAARVAPAALVHSLNEIFSSFDSLVEKHGLEKIKTIGDAYMVVGGLPTPRQDHAEAIAAMALDMQQELNGFNAARGTRLAMRVGIHTGPVIAGIIGQKKFIYDLWGDTVNTASRMEASGETGKIQTSDITYNRLKEKFAFAKRGKVDIKGKGQMTTYYLVARR